MKKQFNESTRRNEKPKEIPRKIEPQKISLAADEQEIYDVPSSMVKPAIEIQNATLDRQNTLNSQNTMSRQNTLKTTLIDQDGNPYSQNTADDQVTLSTQNSQSALSTQNSQTSLKTQNSQSTVNSSQNAEKTAEDDVVDGLISNLTIGSDNSGSLTNKSLQQVHQQLKRSSVASR